jgi:asparagine synthase (glutamine-hydrolysing)
MLLSDAMLKKCVSENSASYIRSIYQSCKSSDPLNRALFYDQVSLLPDQILTFVDRFSMVHSVEVRPPFLDHRIVEFSATIPSEFKINNSINKYILKKVVEDFVPKEIIDRPKEGFVLPTDAWLRGPLKKFAINVLNSKSLNLHGLLNENAVNDLLLQHFRCDRNNGPQIWNLIMFQKWWERHFCNKL